MGLEDKIEIIFNTVCYSYNVKMQAVRGKNRQANIREARQLVAYFIREYTDLSLPNVGYMINRDHSTVIHSIKVVRDQVEFNKEYRLRHELINEIIKTRING